MRAGSLEPGNVKKLGSAPGVAFIHAGSGNSSGMEKVEVRIHKMIFQCKLDHDES